MALSDLDHGNNMRGDRAAELRIAASGEPDEPPGEDPAPNDDGDYLRWFIDNNEAATGSGPNGLADYCDQLLTYWRAREAPNVHLFHYNDLWHDLDGQMRRVAQVLGVPIDEARWPEFVNAATLSSMRARAEMTAPNAHQGLWHSPEQFFRAGGTRDWASLLTPKDIAHFESRMVELAGDAAPWALHGRGVD